MSIAALPFAHCQPRAPAAMPAAFVLSLGLHLVLLFAVGLVWHQAASQSPRTLRIEFLGSPWQADTPPPEQVEALAESNQRAAATEVGAREREATSPLPALPLEPTPPPQADPAPWSGEPAPLVPLVTRIETPRNEATVPAPPPVRKKSGEAAPAKQASRGEAAPLRLSTDLGEVARWDRQRQDQERRRKSEAGEATVNINTREVRYATYFRGVKQQVEQVWSYPPGAREKHITGSLLMEFTINEDGRLLEIEVLRSSGWPELDDGAVAAVRHAGPFSPLPAAWNMKKLHVKATFEYLRRSFTWGQ